MKTVEIIFPLFIWGQLFKAHDAFSHTNDMQVSTAITELEDLFTEHLLPLQEKFRAWGQNHPVTCTGACAWSLSRSSWTISDQIEKVTGNCMLMHRRK